MDEKIDEGYERIKDKIVYQEPIAMEKGDKSVQSLRDRQGTAAQQHEAQPYDHRIEYHLRGHRNDALIVALRRMFRHAKSGDQDKNGAGKPPKHPQALDEYSPRRQRAGGKWRISPVRTIMMADDQQDAYDPKQLQAGVARMLLFHTTVPLFSLTDGCRPLPTYRYGRLLGTMLFCAL